MKCVRLTHLLEVGRVPLSFMSIDVSAKSISKISSAEVVLKDASSCCAAVPVDRHEEINHQKEEMSFPVIQLNEFLITSFTTDVITIRYFFTAYTNKPSHIISSFICGYTRHNENLRRTHTHPGPGMQDVVLQDSMLGSQSWVSPLISSSFKPLKEQDQPVVHDVTYINWLTSAMSCHSWST